MDLMKKRWLVLLACLIINVCIGTGFAWSVYQTAILNEAIYGAADRAAVALAFTICSGVAPICMIAGAPLAKKVGGPRNVMWIGGLMFSVGLVLTSFTTTLPALYLTYGLLVGFGISLCYGLTIGIPVSYFPDKKGLIAGISTAAYGAGAIIFPPIMQSMIASMGVMATMRTLGIIYGVCIIVSAFFVTQPPAGWLPDGYVPPAQTSGGSGAADKNWKQMLADPRFWVMIVVFTIFATGGLMVVSQGSPMSISLGADTAFAATVVSIVAIGNTLGRVIWGWVSDRIGGIRALVCMAAVVAICGFACAALGINAGNMTLFIVFAVLIACCYGGSMGVYPALTADAFGLKNNGVNYGVMFIGFALGGYLGPIIANNLYASTQSYATALTVVGVMGAVALVLILILSKMQKSAQK